MRDGTLYSIGELARRTGLTVKTIRFYSDRGIVAPADRTAAGYRRYGPDAVTRLALVRTLRELGLGLDVIRRVVDQELTLSQVAAEHAAALDVQIGILRLRRAVLAAAARREPTFEEMELMHQLATLSRTEKQRLIDDFLGAVFDGPHAGAAHAAAQRSMTPELPESPTEEQVAAWVELAELSFDVDFRASVRRMARISLDNLPGGGTMPPRPDVAAITRDVVRPAVASDISPDAPQADPIVAALIARCAAVHPHPDSAELQHWLLERLDAATDPRRDRYLHLLALINGWPAPEPLAPAIAWAVAALRTRSA
ncbi:MerR family transcriptional regulator [Streptomyces regalis]|uniref:MerR family transcriptional regulator n=1 Tax=Streptomyces regalis TaxID=68262 RepID=A0A101JNZ5_9ACTN|nr:MerR family transcriptional regulator [Streptomyces regalis]KUL30425.1 MerR family transcriptional regulator [Streptomyces regalis]